MTVCEGWALFPLLPCPMQLCVQFLSRVDALSMCGPVGFWALYVFFSCSDPVKILPHRNSGFPCPPPLSFGVQPGQGLGRWELLSPVQDQ